MRSYLFKQAIHFYLHALGHIQSVNVFKEYGFHYKDGEKLNQINKHFNMLLINLFTIKDLFVTKKQKAINLLIILC